MPTWAKDLLLFAGAAVLALAATFALYVPLANLILRRYAIWQFREPARRRGRKRIRALARTYRETGVMDPELQEVFDEVKEFS